MAALDITQLRHYLVVVEAGSISAAASRLRMSQPWLSQQMKALEADVGGPLLERIPAGVRPTPAGRVLEAEARTLVETEENARRRTRDAIAGDVGSVRVAALVSHLTGPLLPAIREWHARKTRVTLELTCVRESRLALQDLVQRGIVDMGIAPRPSRWDGPIHNLGWNEIVALLPPGDPHLDTDHPVPLSELRDRDFVLYERGFGPADSVLVACADAGFQPRAVVTVPQLDAAARLAAAGLGVALVPEWNVPQELRHLLRPLDSRIGADLTAFTRTAWTASTRALLEVLDGLDWPARPQGAREVDAGTIEDIER